MKKTKLAIIGCGAVTERGHLPTANLLDSCDPVILIDKDKDRARTLASKFNVPEISDNYLDIIGKADSAVVALPHHLHAQVSIELLNAGINVLVEKPMATSIAECKEMINAAESRNVVLSVGLMRRFLHSSLFAKNAIDSGLLGNLESFDFREGNVYNWPVSSEFLFSPHSSGGGVLFDTGAHTLDLLLWWLGDVSLIDYSDDSYGGVEADCEMHLETKLGIKGVVELSRTRDLRNTAIIKGDKASMEVDLRKNSLTLITSDGSSSIIGHGQVKNESDSAGQGFINLFPLQMSDFISSVQNGRNPRTSGVESSKSIALIEECYKRKNPLNLPWMKFTHGTDSEFKGKNILVTGATGFIGGRLVERLVLEQGANVKALVRNYSKASRIARFPIEMISGDVLDYESVLKASKDCEIIMHCAYDFSGGSKQKEVVSVKGTDNVCKATLKNRIKRLVHISTISVYGSTLDGDLDEKSPKISSDDVYSKTKLAAEELVIDYYKKHNLPVTVIQPTIVYGPFSRPWTIGPIKQLSSGKVVLINDGDGLCNAVYIDDVIDAIFLSSVKMEAIGEIFLISDIKPITWKEFYGSFEKILGKCATMSMSDKEVEVSITGRGTSKKYKKAQGSFKQLISLVEDPYIREKLLKIPLVINSKETVKQLMPNKFLAIKSKLGINPDEEMLNSSDNNENTILHIPTDLTRLDLFRSHTSVKIDKAKNILGYKPKYDFDKGMSITSDFIKWANLK